MTLAILIYVAVSFVLGGITATIEIWWQPPGHGLTRYHPPKSTLSDAMLFGVFVMMFWPLLFGAMIIDEWTSWGQK
jgi:hypothetical protein